VGGGTCFRPPVLICKGICDGFNEGDDIPPENQAPLAEIEQF
jgi:hypothetical protein